MNYYIQLFWRIFIRKETPANIPMSTSLMWLLLAATFVVSLLASATAPQMIGKNLGGNLLDIVILALFTHFLLEFFKKKPRFLQTFIALLGIKLMFQLLTLPGILYVSTIENLREPDAIVAFASIFMLVLLVVTLRAIAQVFVFTLEVSHGKAVMFSIMYYFLNLFITLQLLVDTAPKPTA